MITITALRAAGLTSDQIVKVLEEADAERREKARIIKRNQRARPPDTVDTQDSISPSSSLTSTKDLLEISLVATGTFATFWQHYPHKVGKRAAEKSFAAARRRASVEIIMTGLAQYAAKTDDRPWCNPATWLNQDRWTDQPGPQQVINGSPKTSALDYAASFDARTRMQLKEREEMERERQRP